jgi:hypothetical protein
MMSEQMSDRDAWICKGGFGSKEVPLSGIHLGEWFIVSPYDYERCMQHKWFITNGYPTTTIDGKKVYIQQFITGQNYSDHISRDKLDNRRANFFLGGQTENNRNRNLKNEKTTSIYPGVSWSKRDEKWEVRMKDEGKKKNLGLFTNELEAAYTYYQAARKQHPYMNHEGWESQEFLDYVLQQDFLSLNI